MTSDTQQPKITGGHFSRFAKAIENKNYSFAAVVGDLVDNGGDKRNYNDFLRVGSRFMDTIPFVPIIGNHDLRGESYWFNQYFVNGVNKSVSDKFKNGQFYWSFNYSCVHFMIYSFPRGSLDDFSQAQMDWIERDLKNSENMKYKIVMFHCPIVGAGFFGRNNNLINKILPILKQNNITAIISGHEHHYERGVFINEIHQGRDIYYFILGGGGGALDVGLRPQPETLRMTVTPCYTEVHVEPSVLSFKTFTYDGALIDSFKI